jgi:hypothetical protein
LPDGHRIGPSATGCGGNCGGSRRMQWGYDSAAGHIALTGVRR